MFSRPQSQANGPLRNEASPSFAFSSPDGGVSCQVNGGCWFACTSPRVPGSLPYGTYTFEVRASDAAPNTDATPASRAFTPRLTTSSSSRTTWQGTSSRRPPTASRSWCPSGACAYPGPPTRRSRGRRTTSSPTSSASASRCSRASAASGPTCCRTSFTPRGGLNRPIARLLEARAGRRRELRQ